MIRSGRKLPPALVADMKNAIGIFIDSSEKTMQGFAGQYVDAARRRNLDPRQVVTDSRYHPKAEQKPGEGRGSESSPIKIERRNPSQQGPAGPVVDVSF